MYTQEFIDNIKDESIRKQVQEEFDQQKAIQDALKDVDQEVLEQFEDFKAYLYYQPPFSWTEWCVFTPAVKKIAYEILEKRIVENWVNMALSNNNLEFAGNLWEPYDGGALKAQASLAKQRFEESLNADKS